MNLTYETTESGYTIFNDSVAWIIQDGHISYPSDTMAESAQLHIDAIITDHNAELQPRDIDLIRQELADTKRQLTETQDALIELALLLMGGQNNG